MSSTMQEGLMWRCTGCGERNFNHYENCVSCGRARPPPRVGGSEKTAQIRRTIRSVSPQTDVLNENLSSSHQSRSSIMTGRQTPVNAGLRPPPCGG